MSFPPPNDELLYSVAYVYTTWPTNSNCSPPNQLARKNCFAKTLEIVSISVVFSLSVIGEKQAYKSSLDDHLTELHVHVHVHVHTVVDPSTCNYCLNSCEMARAFVTV